MAADSSLAVQLLNANRPLVIAHRGYSMIAPENSLPAFALAIIAGADLVELDYHHSSDAVPIVLHDYTLDRTSDADERWGGSKIEAKTRPASELASLDVGVWFKPQFQGTKLPTLEAALDLIQSNSVTLIERKAGDAKTCVELLKRKNLINSVVVQAFDWSYLRDFHQLEPKQVLGALGPPSNIDGRKLTDDEKQLSAKWIDEVKNTGARAVVWNRQITKEAVEYAHRAGLKVWIYTINDGNLAGQLLDLGIDGIISDNPSLIWRTLALRNAPTAAASQPGR